MAGKMDGWMDRQTGRQTDRWTDRRTDRQTDRQTDHRYRKSPNRLLKVYYVPATSAVLMGFFFLLRPITVLMKQTRQALHAIKQSILLR